MIYIYIYIFLFFLYHIWKWCTNNSKYFHYICMFHICQLRENGYSHPFIDKPHLEMAKVWGECWAVYNKIHMDTLVKYVTSYPEVWLSYISLMDLQKSYNSYYYLLSLNNVVYALMLVYNVCHGQNEYKCHHSSFQPNIAYLYLHILGEI